MQNKWNYHGPPRKNNELKEYLNWIFEIEDVVLFKLYLKVSWIADNCLVKSAVISNLSNLQNMSNLLTFWLSDHPEVGKFFKILSIFHFNMLTLRIEPFWVDEKKFFLGEKIAKNFLLRIFANWSMEIPKMQKKKFEKKNFRKIF